MAERVGVIEYWCICTAGNVMQIKNSSNRIILCIWRQVDAEN